MNVVTYDRWLYMTMFGRFKVAFIVFRERMKLTAFLRKGAWNVDFAGKLFWTVYFQKVAHKQVLILDIMAPAAKRIAFANLRLADTQLSYAGAQGAAVEAKDFSRAVFAADFPMGLFKYLDNIIALDRFQSIVT